MALTKDQRAQLTRLETVVELVYQRDAAAYRAHHAKIVELETSISQDVAAQLEAKGHKIRWAEVPIGGGQMIRIDPQTGALAAASEPRKDGCALAW